jgi:hypothetical protein
MTFLEYFLVAIIIAIVSVTINTVIFKYGIFNRFPHKDNVDSVHTMNLMLCLGSMIWPLMIAVFATMLAACGFAKLYKWFFIAIAGRY